MSDKARVDFVTVVPSPYQRDLFGALAARPELDVRVFYLEAESPDSPWPPQPLRSWETVLPGSWLSMGGGRWHFNHRLPDFSNRDFVVLSSYSSATGQWLMRSRLRSQPWLYWGERVRPQASRVRDGVQRTLLSPLRKAAAIVGMGLSAMEDYRRRFPQQAHYCIPYHCDLTPFLARQRQRSGGEPVTFLFCGQMIHRKGVDLLLSAFDRLVATGVRARLLLVGREAELPQFLAGVSPSARAAITYEGFHAPDRLAEMFSRADVFVIPSRHDGWGVVVNQALGAGLPVITSDAVGAGLDLVAPECNGLRFRSGDVDGLFDCMQRLATDPALVRQWGVDSRTRALALSPEAGAEKWVRVFDALRQPERCVTERNGPHRETLETRMVARAS